MTRRMCDYGTCSLYALPDSARCDKHEGLALPPRGRRCDSLTRKGSGVGICDRPLDRHGYCDRPSDHVESM